MDENQLLKVIKALADGNRLRMLQEIATVGELSCGEVVERFSIAQATVSHHLKILVDSGLVEVRREGQFGFFSVNKDLFSQFIEALGTVLPDRGQKTTADPTAKETSSKASA